jgi:hypothetical protein
VLTIKVAVGVDQVDEQTNEIVNSEYFMLDLEHSLASMSKWESKFEVPFHTDEQKTDEQALWYIHAMTVTPNVPEEVYARLSRENYEEAYAYINSKQTATWFSEAAQGANGLPARKETITAELVYYWMVAHNIPFEAQYWHLNRLFTLIKVCNEKNAAADKKKRSKADMVRDRKLLNAQRKEQYNTKG